VSDSRYPCDVAPASCARCTRIPCWRARWWLLALVLCLSACATRPPASDYPREITHALPAATPTPLQAAVTQAAAAHPGENGFRSLWHGTDALQARIALAVAATRTLDLQYYIAREDNTGKLLLEALLRAADRGVRVRLLVDDLNFRDIDSTIAALNAHKNIEVRIFNPFATASQSPLARIGNVLTHLDKLTHRMHNKAMIADNQVAIIGGRNLGDEYFDASPDVIFRDLDVLAAGPIVQQVSDSFDTYWNSREAYPLRALNKQTFAPEDIVKVREMLRAHWERDAAFFSAKPLNATPLATQIARDQLDFIWARAEFLVDSPRKVEVPDDQYESPLVKRLRELAPLAQREFLAMSPYFVPHDAGIDLARRLHERGVALTVLTNSLAATDAPAVQAGYAPYRVPLLQAGVRLYEFKPVGRAPDTSGIAGLESKASLHAKVYVIDRQILVVGSMNLDPRSEHLNTELALVIYSSKMAGEIAELFDHGISPKVSYHVTLAPSEEVELLSRIGVPPSPLLWTAEENGRIVTYNYDPQAGLLRNLATGIFSILPVRDQL